MTTDPPNRPGAGPRLLSPPFPHDPRSVPLAQRRRYADELAAAQAAWLPRLRTLCDTAPPADDFPAFLLATEAFLSLRRRLGAAVCRRALPADVADELDHFVDAYRDYLRTDEREDAFAPTNQRVG
ncbi:MAG: hypothetical protein IPK26_15385 [Planctomycetes bacterium]|nr:hypothetical protein [Planctomycetota bacterium]